MREVLRTNDPVLLAFARHLLAEAGIAHLVLDEHMAAVEGSIGAIQRRLVVATADEPAARRVLSALEAANGTGSGAEDTGHGGQGT